MKVMRRKEVEAFTGLSRSTIYLKIEKNEFPKQIKLGARSVGWLESEVQDWLKNQIIKSRGGIDEYS